MTQHTSDGFGEQVRDKREALGLSQVGLAYRAGVNLRTVERIEGGEVKPRPATVTVIRQALEAVAAEAAKAAA